MAKKEATRRCCSNRRAKGVHGKKRDADIVAQVRAYRILGWLVGIAFGVMFALGIIGG